MLLAGVDLQLYEESPELVLNLRDKSYNLKYCFNVLQMLVRRYLNAMLKNKSNVFFFLGNV